MVNSRILQGMSIFSDVLPGELAGKSPFESRAEAFLAILIVLGHSDGDFSNVEITRLSELLRSRATFAHLNLVHSVKRLQKLSTELGGVDAVLAAASAVLSESQREAAFVNAVDLAFSDGLFDDTEMLFLLRVQNILRLPDRFGEQAMHVIGIKNRI